jgi:hypothetical protein
VSDNLDEFNRELADAARDLTEREIVLLHQRTHLDALGRVVKRTPVDTGRTRGNWQSTLGAPASGEVAARTGEAVNAEGLQVIGDVEPFGVSAITNNLDHILVLEEGGFVPTDPGPSKDRRPSRKGRVLVEGGFSVQAPRGMVAITVEELKDSLSK